MCTVAVGTDGSPNAIAALQWAFDDARRSEAVAPPLKGATVVVLDTTRGDRT